MHKTVSLGVGLVSTLGFQFNPIHIQWNLVIKRSNITKPSYNKVILLVPALYISLFFDPDIMRNLI